MKYSAVVALKEQCKKDILNVPSGVHRHINGRDITSWSADYLAYSIAIQASKIDVLMKKKDNYGTNDLERTVIQKMIESELDILNDMDHNFNRLIELQALAIRMERIDNTLVLYTAEEKRQHSLNNALNELKDIL